MPDKPLLDRAMFWVAVAGVMGVLGGFPLAIGLAQTIPEQKDLWSNTAFVIGVLAEVLGIGALWWAITLHWAHGHAMEHLRHDPQPRLEPLPRPVPIARAPTQDVVNTTLPTPNGSDRIILDITPTYLVGLFKEHTSVEANRRIMRFKGENQWLSIRGRVTNVFSHQSDYVYVQVDYGTESTLVGCSFQGTAAEEVKSLRKNDVIQVIGQLGEVDTLSLKLENCELVSYE